MNALTPRPVFQVLVMSEGVRLGRESIETAYAMRQLVQAGVRVFFYLTDTERTLDSPMDKVMLSLAAFAEARRRNRLERFLSRPLDARRQAGVEAQDAQATDHLDATPRAAGYEDRERRAFTPVQSSAVTDRFAVPECLPQDRMGHARHMVLFKGC
jgi:DNA invertase Pin-like site-specific DNA recombinase